MTPPPGPCETLARLSLQSTRYVEDADFRTAVDAVLGRPEFDAAPALREACERTLRMLTHLTTAEYSRGADREMREILMAALAKAKETP